jgi:hypothetical protein
MPIWGWIVLGLAGSALVVLLVALAIVVRSIRRQPGDGSKTESWSSLLFDGDWFGNWWGS